MNTPYAPHPHHPSPTPVPTSAPVGVWLMRVLSAVQGFLYLACVVLMVFPVYMFGLLGVSAATQQTAEGIAVALGSVGGMLVTTFLIVLFGLPLLIMTIAPRRRWIWPLGIFITAMYGLLNICSLPLVVLVLVLWFQPDVRAWFESSPR